MVALYAALLAWVRALVPTGVTVSLANNNLPSPPRPFVTMRVSMAGMYGEDRTGVDGDGVELYTRFLSFTLALQVYGRPSASPVVPPEAEEIAQTMLDRVGNLQVRDQHLGGTIAFNQVLTGPQTVDAIMGSQWEPRTVMDFGMSATRDVLITAGLIETIEVSGETSGTVSGTPVETEFTITVADPAPEPEPDE